MSLCVGEAPYPGAHAFELKATLGMPMDEVFHRIMVKHNMRLDWVGFIEAARRNGWWDFQTIEAVQLALEDAGVETDTRHEIVRRLKRYVVLVRHPMMVDQCSQQ